MKWINYSEESKGDAFMSTDQRFTLFRLKGQTSFSLFDREKKVGVFGSMEDARGAAEKIVEVCEQCGGTGRRATARSASGIELARHEKSGTRCDCRKVKP